MLFYFFENFILKIFVSFYLILCDFILFYFIIIILFYFRKNFVNSVQTVTQKQCTESKAGWVHQVHSLANLRTQGRPGTSVGAVSWPCGNRVVDWPPDRIAGQSAVSWPRSRQSSRVSSPPSGHNTLSVL